MAGYVCGGPCFLGVLQEVLGLGPSKSKGLGKMLHIYIYTTVLTTIRDFHTLKM